MKSWKARLGLVLAMLAMVLAVSVPAMADSADDYVDELLEEGEFEADDLDLEDCVLDNDGDGFTDEEIENFLDDDGDELVDEDLAEDLEDAEVTCTVTLEADDFVEDDEDDDEDEDDEDDDEDEDE